MKSPSSILSIALSLLLLAPSLSCKKYLDTKSVQTLSSVETLADLEAILNNLVLNSGAVFPYTNTDEFVLDYADWQSLYEPYNNSYIWDGATENSTDWQNLYIVVFHANTVLDNLKEMSTDGETTRSNSIKGAALFHRARAFFDLLQLYSPASDPADGSKKLGIPLRLDADFNKPSIRASVKDSYARIIKDLEEAVSLLPSTPKFKNQPAKISCHALLARTYLQTGDYAKASKAATDCLNIDNTLLDYNSSDIDTLAGSPFKLFNREVIFYVSQGLPISTAKIDPGLYSAYDDNDLRKVAFFGENPDGSHFFRGSYNGDPYQLFGGLATDEIYLIRAETYIRTHQSELALKDLNTLLSTRYRENTFTPVTSTSASEILERILLERRKELVYRGIRWSDIKRLNREPGFATTIKRDFNNGETYTIAPNDVRYAFLIPQEVIANSSINQNPR